MTDDYGPDIPIEVSRSDEYHALEDAVQQYMDAGPEEGYDVWRALASLLGSAACERFQEHWGVDEAVETACIRRLITGAEECTCSSTRSWIDREFESIVDHDEPPHAPPHHDHPTLWLNDGEPVLYSMHVYNPELQIVSKTASEQQKRNGWFDIVEFAREWGLEIGVTPYSWYNLFSTVNIVFYAPEWLRERP